jgi:hypothetical protein
VILEVRRNYKPLKITGFTGVVLVPWRALAYGRGATVRLRGRAQSLGAHAPQRPNSFQSTPRPVLSRIRMGSLYFIKGEPVEILERAVLTSPTGLNRRFCLVRFPDETEKWILYRELNRKPGPRKNARKNGKNGKEKSKRNGNGEF